MKYKIYTGIGSRKTPTPILEKFDFLAFNLAKLGWTLRSGAAEGADSAFEKGCIRAGGAKEIYLPFKYFRSNNSPLYNISDEAYSLAEHYHPAWDKCNFGARKLQARNGYQVLGQELNRPTKAIICWTPASGGTQQALRIAKDKNIPIYNFYDQDYDLDYLLLILEKSI